MSDLALVMRPRWGDGVLEGFVLDANSRRADRRGRRPGLGPRSTGTTATARADGQDRRERPVLARAAAATSGYLVLATHKDQQLATANDYYSYQQQPQPRAATSRRSSSPTARSTGPARRSSTRASASRVDQEAGQLQDARQPGADGRLPATSTARRSPGSSTRPTTTARSAAASPRRATG